jgi:CheY-like chemotaxis protein
MVHPNKTYKGVRILVVEDSEINQEIINGILTMFGISPTFAYTGLECLELLNKSKFDLVFMDILLPGINGLETTNEIRSCQKDYKDIPIVAMTSKNEEEEVEQCYAAGMNDFLGKPFNIEMIATILYKHLTAFTQENLIGRMSNINTILNDKIHIPGVNVSEGIVRFGGKIETYYRSILSFVTDLNLENLSFEEFISRENFTENAKIIHTIKGVSGNLSIEEIFRNTVVLERNFLNGTLEKTTFEEWIESCTEVKRAILTFSSKVKENKDSRIGSIIELNMYLEDLHQALVKYSVTACDEILDVLRSASWGDEQNEFLEYLYKVIEDYEFELAINLLREREQYFKVPFEC